MENEDDIQARLQQMVEEDPLGREAKQLLCCLNVFQEAFSKPVVKAIAPEEMSKTQRDAAFATLQQWGFVYKRTRNRYEITPAVRPHAPPMNEILTRHFAYFRTRMLRCSELWSYMYWKDFALAILWGLERNLVNFNDFEENAGPGGRLWAISLEWPHIVEAVRQTADALKISAQLITSNPISKLSTTWHEIAFERYTAIGNPYQQCDRLLQKARAALVTGQQALARQYAERTYAIASSPSISSLQIKALDRLLDIAIAQNDRDAVLSYIQQWRAIARDHIDILQQIALKMKKFNQPISARHYFVEAAHLSSMRGEDPYHGRLYRDWAHFEYRQGNIQEALNLYRLSMIGEMAVVDGWVNYNDVDSENGWYVFKQLCRKWQAIEAAWNPL